MAGRPRTPTNVLALRGAFDKDPQRRREDPATSGEIGAAPKHLTKEQKAIWREIKGQAPIGVMTNADRQALEDMCVLVDKRRTEKISISERRLLFSYLGRFGMTPADRAKIAGPPTKPKSRFEDL